MSQFWWYLHFLKEPPWRWWLGTSRAPILEENQLLTCRVFKCCSLSYNAQDVPTKTELSHPIIDRMCVSPQFIFGSPNSQWDGIRRWVFGRWIELAEVLRMGPHDGISVLVRKDQRAFPLSPSLSPLCLSVHHVRTQQECSCLRARKRVSADPQPCWYANLRLPASRTMRNKLLHKPSSLWCFLIAA